MTETDTTRPPVDIAGVTKTYGEQKAVDDVSLQVHPGESLALLGHNTQDSADTHNAKEPHGPGHSTE